MVVRIFTKITWKQSWSHESNREILVDFIGDSAVKRKLVSGNVVHCPVLKECKFSLEIRW